MYVGYIHLLLWAFDSSYVFFFSASFFFALIASTWHHMRISKHALSLPGFATRKIEPNHQAYPCLTPAKEKRQQFNYKSFGDMLPAQLSLNWLKFYHKFRVIADVLAVLAPRSSMQLYRGMACGWFFLIFCSPRMAKSSMPFRGSASVKRKQYCRTNDTLSKVLLHHTKTMSPAIKTEQSNTFLILILYFSQPFSAFKTPNSTCSNTLGIILPQ